MNSCLPEIAFDESGNTGADLLNEDQPVFVLASTSLARDCAEELLYIVRSPQTKEVKFSRLKKSETGRKKLCNILSSAELNSENVITTYYYKKFMVVTKVVDLLIETLAHADGIDLYKNGANIATANLHFYCMPAFCGEGRMKTFLRRFVEMIRERSTNSIRRFYMSARTLYENSKNDEYKKSLSPIIASEQMIKFILSKNDKSTLDPAIPAFVHHCAVWGERFDGPFNLVHDDSKPIFQNKESLEKLMTRGEEEKVIGYDRRKMIFPLRAKGISFDRSENDPRLQIVDLIASASAYWANGNIREQDNEEFWNNLDEIKINRFGQDAIWPTRDITPKELGTEFDGGVNVVDHIADFLKTKR